jgi:NodT family efflux transporter outer membrane factor (OMF) lipoprotein
VTGFQRGILISVAVALSTGCTVGPDYRAPSPVVEPAWTAALPHSGDEAALIGWWERFSDPTLLRLVQAAESDSPDLALAWARIEEARANLTGDMSAVGPQVSGGAGVTRNGPLAGNQGQPTMSSGPLAGGQGRPTTARSVSVDATWEIDIFGSVQRSTEKAQATLGVRTADWHAARVSLAAEVARTYVSYRSAELLVEEYRQEQASSQRTADLTRRKVQAGFAAPADAELAVASAAQVANLLISQQAEVAQYHTALAALTGLPRAKLETLMADGRGSLPSTSGLTVTAVPVQVLAQRPDVAAAERSLAVASAAIGVAEADRYPRLTLSGDITLGRQRSDGVSLGTSTWSFGPSLSLPLFDGGRRAAEAQAARARYEQAYATWRKTVRSAVQESENALITLDATVRRQEGAERATAGYDASLAATTASWEHGGTSLIDLETVRRQALSARRDLISLRASRIAAWISLYKALGGGWTPDTQAHPPLTTGLAESSQPRGDQP